MFPAGVKYVSLHEESGYGVAARRTIAALRKAGVPVTWAPMVPGRSWKLGYEPFRGRAAGDAELDPVCNAAIDYDVVIAHTVPEYFPLLAAREPEKRLVGSTVWETTRLPRHWPALLAVPDRLIVPCSWNREVFVKGGVKVPIDVVAHPLGEDVAGEPWSPPGVRPDDFVFYTIGIWSDRKAVDLTVRAFLRAFTADDPVVLVVKTTERDFTKVILPSLRGSTSRTLAKLTRRHRRPARVILVNDVLDRRTLVGLHARGDCYLSLCRSEGWGLGAFEAAGFGKPVIITGFGGHLDYLPPGYDLLVDYRLVPVLVASGWRSYSPDQRWARPSVEHGAVLMRRMFAEPELARRRGAELGTWVRSRFSGDQIAAKVVQTLREVGAAGTRRGQRA